MVYADGNTALFHTIALLSMHRKTETGRLTKLPTVVVAVVIQVELTEVAMTTTTMRTNRAVAVAAAAAVVATSVSVMISCIRETVPEATPVDTATTRTTVTDQVEAVVERGEGSPEARVIST